MLAVRRHPCVSLVFPLVTHREDRAKYLYNLDPNSAYYDPKTHSMRDNPNPHIPLEETTFAGDNFVRHTGDALEFAKVCACVNLGVQPVLAAAA